MGLCLGIVLIPSYRRKHSLDRFGAFGKPVRLNALWMVKGSFFSNRCFQDRLFSVTLPDITEDCLLVLLAVFLPPAPGAFLLRARHVVTPFRA